MSTSAFVTLGDSLPSAELSRRLSCPAGGTERPSRGMTGSLVEWHPPARDDQGMESPFVSLRQRHSEGIRLFCFPYAGGGAGVFRHWPDALPGYIEPVAAVLPGREARFTEEPYRHMDAVITHLVDALPPWLGTRFAFFGYSMGARIALALTQALLRRGMPGPDALFVGGSPGPGLAIDVPGWKDSDDDLAAHLRALGGVPPEVAAEPELLSLMLPTVRADLTVVATWPYCRYPVRAPIHAFAGTDDSYASPARMKAWEAETGSWFRLKTMPGGHFFLHDQTQQLADQVTADLSALARDRHRAAPIPAPAATDAGICAGRLGDDARWIPESTPGNVGEFPNPPDLRPGARG